MADPRAGAAGAGVDPGASFPLPALPLELPADWSRDSPREVETGLDVRARATFCG